MIRISLFLLFLSPLASAQTEIHRCVDEDGNIAFQDSPCPESPADAAPGPATDVPVDTVADTAETPPDAEHEDVVSYLPVESDRSIEEVEACKEPHRDAIDSIEAEMLRGYSAEQGETYKQELRTLTQAMRACE